MAFHDEGELAGQTTYRLFMHMLNEDDFLSSCSGDADSPLVLESTSAVGTTTLEPQLERKRRQPRSVCHVP